MTRPTPCDDILALFPDAEAGRLSTAARARLETHRETCPDCARTWAELEQAVLLSREALGSGFPAGGTPPAPEDAPADYWQEFLPRLRARLADAPTRGGRRPVWALPAAAALILGFALGFLLAAGVGLVPVPDTAVPSSSRLAASASGTAASEETRTTGEDPTEEVLLPLALDDPWDRGTPYDLVDTLDEEELDLLLMDLLGELS